MSFGGNDDDNDAGFVFSFILINVYSKLPPKTVKIPNTPIKVAGFPQM